MYDLARAENFTIKSKDQDIPYVSSNGFAILNVSGDTTLALQVKFELEQKVRKNINTTNNADSTFSFMAGPLRKDIS